MKNNLLFEFSVNKENKSINVKKEFDAARPVVWDAFTKSEWLDKWWGPKPWNARTKSMDFKEGGKWLYAMVGPDGEEHWASAEYTRIDPLKSITTIDSFTDKDGNVLGEMPGSTWNMTFTDKNNGTLFNCDIQFQDLSQLEGYIKTGFEQGFTTTLHALSDMLSNGQ